MLTPGAFPGTCPPSFCLSCFWQGSGCFSCTLGACDCIGFTSASAGISVGEQSKGRWAGRLHNSRVIIWSCHRGHQLGCTAQQHSTGDTGGRLPLELGSCADPSEQGSYLTPAYRHHVEPHAQCDWPL